MKIKDKEKYIANGKQFTTFKEVIEYAKENGFQITNTETIHGEVHLVTLQAVLPDTETLPREEYVVTFQVV